MRTSPMPNREQASSQIWSMGTPWTGRRHLGILSVSGRKRVPCPAATRKLFTVNSLDFMKVLQSRARVGSSRIFLLAQDGPGMVSRTRKEKHEIGFKVLQHRAV